MSDRNSQIKAANPSRDWRIKSAPETPSKVAASQISIGGKKLISPSNQGGGGVVVIVGTRLVWGRRAKKNTLRYREQSVRAGDEHVRHPHRRFRQNARDLIRRRARIVVPSHTQSLLLHHPPSIGTPAAKSEQIEATGVLLFARAGGRPSRERLMLFMFYG